MSTKASIKYKEPSIKRPGYHLYTDFLDDDEVVFLRLDGVVIDDLSTIKSGGASVTVKLPLSTAQELGLLPTGSED